jgi:hypothetical protein
MRIACVCTGIYGSSLDAAPILLPNPTLMQRFYRSIAVVIILLTSMSLRLSAQTASIQGAAADSASGTALPGATASVISASNTVLGGAVCDSKGRFLITNLPEGSHTLSIKFLGYETLRRRVRLSAGDTLRLGSLRLAQSSVTTEAVEVEAVQTRGEQRGDTTEFNAKAYKTDKNASAEDLVRKMPGVEIDNGQVKAQGEQVRRVLVDGKPFFGDDAATTLKTLPSDIIDKVQVYDQGSDQAQFTKFDDGERNKTINVVTRADRRNGIFGKGFAGYGTDDRYNSGANVNLFQGDRRITVLALSNNINEQNFAIQDLMGMMGGGGGGGSWMRMAGRSMAMFSTSGGSRMAGMGSRGGGGGSDFMISPSDGISRTHGLGLNYQDQFGKSVAVTGSYFFNTSKTDQLQSLNRIYYLTEQAAQSNSQDNNNLTDNTNHRLNLRAEVSLDSMSSLLVSPRLTWQNLDKNSASQAETQNLPSSILNQSTSTTASTNSAFNLSSDILYRLRFATEGRTLSANLTNNVRNNTGNSDNLSENIIFGSDTILLNIHQNTPSSGKTNSINTNLTYTEPVATNHQLQVNYTFNASTTTSDRNTYNADNPTLPLPGLSNASTSDYITHKGGMSYRFSIVPPPDSTGKPKADPMMMMMGGGGGMGRGMMGMMGGAVGTWTFALGADYQLADLRTSQSAGSSTTTQSRFYNVLPNISVVARPSMSSNVRFSYRTSTNSPSIQQLQEVIDNTDPLRLYRGNASLKQEFTHSVFANYGSFNMITASGLFGMINVNVTNDRIVNSTLTSGINPLTGDTIRLGSQFTSPVNRNGFVNANSFLVYSFPVEIVRGFKLNLNTNAGVIYSRDISLINNAENVAQSLILTPSLGISSNISENTDFSLSARVARTSLNNSIQSELNSVFTTATIIGRGTFITKSESALLDGWVATVDASYIVNSGLSSSAFNQTIPLCNLGLGRRFLDGRGELKLSVFDALNQNNAVNRTTGSFYVEDTRTQVLQRYFLLTFTYNLRSFGQ